MAFSRRQALRLLGAGALVGAASASTGCSLLGGSTPQPLLLPSAAPLPKPFRTTLPRLPVLKPSRTDGTTDYYDLAQRTGTASILPGLETPILGYDGRFPGPTIEARSGRGTVVRIANGLEVPTVTHLHGGRTPPSSDGYPTDLVKPGSTRTHEFPLDQRAATLWYHDHRMDYTGPQVWRGLAGFFLVRDDEEARLPLPHGDRELPLLICDRSFGKDGALLYPGLRGKPGVREGYAGGVLGDVILVNGAPWPELRVARARYRFRVLNASNARTYELALSSGKPFVQIGTDGGLIPAPQSHSTVRLAPAERADLVVDFSAYKLGDKIELRNNNDDGPQSRVMRFVVDSNVKDDSAIPRKLSTVEPLDPAKAKETRTFEFASGDLHGHTGWLINGKPFDPRRMDARPKLDSTEIWHLRSDISHPIHLHLAHFQVLSVDGDKPAGPPVWKDTVELQEQQDVEIITRFSGYRGRYVFHCHNLEHEDMAMMANFEVV